MLQKITELWPGLVRYVGQEDEEEGQQPVGSQDSNNEDEPGQGVDEEQIQQDFRHLYWTRLMVIGEDEPEQERKWPLADDIIEECLAVEQLQLDEADR